MTMISAGASRPLGQPHHLRPEPAVRDLEDRRGARTTLSHFDDSSDEDDYDDDNDSNINNKNNATNNDHDDDFSARDNGQDVQTPTPSSHSHIPLHPIPSMQEAFAESLEEATKADVTSQKPKLRDQDPKQRRDRLLDQDRSQGPPNRLWRFRPGQRCHELRKLIAQISFGVELLIKGMANSDAQVLSILQGHIDEVDEFLEAAMEDVQQATLDLKQRLDFLKVPLQNMDVFEQMLENRKFRLQIVEGNVKIEHILSRTSTAHTQTIRDVSEGLWGVKQFAHYLKENEKGPWRQDRPDVVDVFEAMKGNTDGWHSAFTTLESNSTLLSGLLVQLSSLVNDIDKKAGEVSRRTRFTLEPYSAPEGRAVPRSPESLLQATPPPSPPTLKPDVPPRIKTILFDNTMSSFLQDPESPNDAEFAAKSRQRITKDSDTLRNTMLAGHAYTPPESSRTIPEVTIDQGHQLDDDSSRSVAESETSDESKSSNATDEDDDEDDDDEDNDNLLYILQPRTYTPVPPAPIPSPRVSDTPNPTARISIPSRGSPDELSIHIEAEEDMPQSPDEVRETVLTVPRRNSKRAPTMTVQQPKPLQIQPLHVKPLQIQQVRTLQTNPSQRQSRSSDKEVVLGHKTSLRERVSLKGEVPKAIHVPPVNAHEFQRPRYATPQGSPRSQTHQQQQQQQQNQQSFSPYPQPPGSSRGPDMPRHPDAQRRHQTSTGNLDYHPPAFPSLLPSPASERQHFRPVQASPHSPLQQRPHTAGTVHRPRLHTQNTGSSTLSRVMSSTMTTTTDKAGSTRTVKKKRSAFGWLKKAFSLDEEERAMFEARKRAMPVNYYAPFQQGHGGMEVQSPRYLDGRRIA